MSDSRTSIVEIDSGPVCGVGRGEMTAFLGIPFAAPPVGPLRWMPPQAPAPWSDTRNCHEYGNDSLQRADLGVFGGPGGDEDCLHLNVFVPNRPAFSHARLPVMVWIHGGATLVGSGRDYDPRKLVAKGQVIVVTVNYRLGIMGYFSHPEVDAEGHPFGNYGLMDQQFALRWVQRNIEAFGGDPGNVTVFGESSGGNSTLAHLVSPLSSGTFQHAIMMSGGAPALKWPAFGAAVPIDEARRKGTEFAKTLDCESASDLRAAPAARLLAAQGPYVATHQFLIDGQVVPAHPGEILRSGNFNRATLALGHTTDEGTFFAGLTENGSGVAMTEVDYEREMESFFGYNAARVLEEYSMKKYQSPAEAYSAVFTDHMFACTTPLIAAWASKWTPTYVYEFNDKTAPSYLEPTTFALGASHTYELPYLFEGFRGAAGLPVKLNPLQEKLSDKMIEYWSTMSEATARENEWPRYDPEADNVLVLTLPEPRVVSGYYAKFHRLEFWKSLGIYGP